MLQAMDSRKRPLSPDAASSSSLTTKKRAVNSASGNNSPRLKPNGDLPHDEPKDENLEVCLLVRCCRHRSLCFCQLCSSFGRVGDVALTNFAGVPQRGYLPSDASLCPRARARAVNDRRAREAQERMRSWHGRHGGVLEPGAYRPSPRSAGALTWPRACLSLIHSYSTPFAHSFAQKNFLQQTSVRAVGGAYLFTCGCLLTHTSRTL